ncbi:MAG: hypothetical protein ACOC4G_03310 [Bacillota bacterium]
MITLFEEEESSYNAYTLFLILMLLILSEEALIKLMELFKSQ